jgi:hypothetical protein
MLAKFAQNNKQKEPANFCLKHTKNELKAWLKLLYSRNAC